MDEDIQVSGEEPAEASDGPVVWPQVALDVPLGPLFEYRCPFPCEPGQRVIVPFGRRQLVGIVVEVHQEPQMTDTQHKDVLMVLDDMPPLPGSWLELSLFAAGYYHRHPGEVMLPAMPVMFRKASAYLGKRSGSGPVNRLRKRMARYKPESCLDGSDHVLPAPPTLTPDQQAALDAIDRAGPGFHAFLLHGVTGSGKTELYLHAALKVLAAGGTVLFLVPEINLTPQFAQALRARLSSVVKPGEIALLHSGLADGERAAGWLSALESGARVVLGTRLAVFAPMPRIDLIVVDEEHDPSYKQQEGLRYSARDLAVWRARQHGARIILGSATPSLESWEQAHKGRYVRLTLSQRARSVTLPEIKLVDTRRLKLDQGLSIQVLDAMRSTLEQGQQVLVYLNRRGYAPVLHCASCGWVSHCGHCSVFTVLHKVAGDKRPSMRLHCHHCGMQRPVPLACPDCGDQDLRPMGRGTQRLEEHLQVLFPDRRVLRIDADSTRRKGRAETLFAHVHSGDVDILVGTQMVSKGHDFSNLGLVAVLNADSALFSHDFRAPERLFAQLMQVAGRAGRHSGQGLVMVQTDYPEQPVYQALVRHDFAGFASTLLREREQAGLPPFSYQALLTAQARELPIALAFLEQARESANQWLQQQQIEGLVVLYDAVALRVVKVADLCRAQVLIESQSRALLQKFLTQWLPSLGPYHGPSGLRWQIEVDPLEI